MDWIVENMELVLLVAGVLTATMFVQVLIPQTMVERAFGEVPDTPTGLLLSRNWAMLVGLGGLLLIYAAYHPETRLPILAYAILGKLAFIVMVLAGWSHFKNRSAVLYAGTDFVMCALFAWYLVATELQ